MRLLKLFRGPPRTRIQAGEDPPHKNWTNKCFFNWLLGLILLFKPILFVFCLVETQALLTHLPTLSPSLTHLPTIIIVFDCFFQLLIKKYRWHTQTNLILFLMFNEQFCWALILRNSSIPRLSTLLLNFDCWW